MGGEMRRWVAILRRSRLDPSHSAGTRPASIPQHTVLPRKVAHYQSPDQQQLPVVALQDAAAVLAMEPKNEQARELIATKRSLPKVRGGGSEPC